MSKQLLFWILMLVWFLCELGFHWPSGERPINRYGIGGSILLFIIILILGWAQFGAPVK